MRAARGRSMRAAREPCLRAGEALRRRALRLLRKAAARVGHARHQVQHTGAHAGRGFACATPTFSFGAHAAVIPLALPVIWRKPPAFPPFHQILYPLLLDFLHPLRCACSRRWCCRT
eukprot:1978501-Pleurochrysis_carterae.AAC.2